MKELWAIKGIGEPLTLDENLEIETLKKSNEGVLKYDDDSYSFENSL